MRLLKLTVLSGLSVLKTGGGKKKSKSFDLFVRKIKSASKSQMETTDLPTEYFFNPLPLQMIKI